MRTAVSTVSCGGCGCDASQALYPFRCPRADELPDVDHLIVRAIDPSLTTIESGETNPFLRYRRFLFSYHYAISRGVPDAVFVDLVRRLDEKVARVDQTSFVVTPLRRPAALEARLGLARGGSLWVKDETGAVSGSHKARHLMGLMIYLEIVRMLGLDDPRRRGLAIASCGNAALAASVVARATDYPLRVFVPGNARSVIVRQIQSLGASVEVCTRPAGSRGDPAYRRFRSAVVEGAIPFGCQGADNGLTIEGGETLWYEVAEALANDPPDRVFVQVGGGALASACVQAFGEMQAAGTWSRRPRIHAVQTRGASPLKRAFDRVAERVQGSSDPGSLENAMRYARTHRSSFMWPWESEPASVAHGILDDETYDWSSVVEGMLRSGGSPIVVGEDELIEANRVARDTTGIDVDHTGSSGLAGLMQLLRTEPSAASNRMLVLFSGARRRDDR